MCTCITYENGDFYFGRNLDLESSFGEKVVVTPRNHPFRWREMEREKGPHFAMIGMGAVAGDTPLYAEAVNEKGLAMAGLNFGKCLLQPPGRRGAIQRGHLRADPLASGKLRVCVTGGGTSS